MTHRDVALGREIVARWCNLAERRLEYLTELFETGRWRRFHSEVQFLQNIQEAKAAVETWRDLLRREASLDNSTIDMSWIGCRRTTPLPRDAPTAVAPPRDVLGDVPVAVESQFVVAEEAPSAPNVPVLHKMPPPALKLDVMKERYPLLRNAM